MVGERRLTDVLKERKERRVPVKQRVSSCSSLVLPLSVTVIVGRSFNRIGKTKEREREKKYA